MAFYVNFPNAYDDLAGHKGSNIMLHATNEPDRLNKNYDSLGCVVVRNEEIKEIEPYVRLGLTPILIFPELTDDYMHPGKDEALKGFFDELGEVLGDEGHRRLYFALPFGFFGARG